MTHAELLLEIKPIFIKRLESIIPQIAYLANPDIPFSVYQDSVYTDIMALGYNFNNQKKAVDDIYETQSLMHGENANLLYDIKKRVEESANLYPLEVQIFSTFHKLSQGCSSSSENFKQVVTTVKRLMDNINN